MKTKKKHKHARMPKDPFAYIAMWQMLTFFALVLLVWVNELRDWAGLVFDAKPSEANLFRGFILTAFVIVAAIVTVGNTFIQQQRVVKNLISVCAQCHRVRLNETVWQKMEEYIGERSLLTFTHGLCPECTRELMETIEKKPGSDEAPSD
ncbi:MAG: hypothetical protein WC299_04040 [Kiritimatiellia bacterium]